MARWRDFSQIWGDVVARPLQLGLFVKGSITLVIDGEHHDLHMSDMYFIRSRIPRCGESGPDGAPVIDVFSPVRSDWNDAPRLAVTEGRWP
jgi:hypothetical protein